MSLDILNAFFILRQMRIRFKEKSRILCWICIERQKRGWASLQYHRRIQSCVRPTQIEMHPFFITAIDKYSVASFYLLSELRNSDLKAVLVYLDPSTHAFCKGEQTKVKEKARGDKLV